jgi:hypothetical protein
MSFNIQDNQFKSTTNKGGKETQKTIKYILLFYNTSILLKKIVKYPLLFCTLVNSAGKDPWCLFFGSSEMSGYFHALTNLVQGKERAIPRGQEAGCTMEPVWICLRSTRERN